MRLFVTRLSMKETLKAEQLPALDVKSRREQH